MSELSNAPLGIGNPIPMSVDDCNCRQSAQNVLRGIIEKIYRGGEALELIEKNMNWQKLKPDEEEKLWMFFISFPKL